MLKSELDLVKQSKDWYLFHDHLEEINSPLYFHQFIDRAAGHQLQYLAEADFSTMLSTGFPPEAADTLKRICPDIIRKEQYMDFMRNRFFRQTLLCHQERSVNRNLNAESLKGLLIASSASPESETLNLSPGKKQSFRTPAGLTFNTDFPPTKAALAVLHRHWPKAVNQDRLKRQTNEEMGHGSDITDKEWHTVLGDLLHCYTLNIIELHTWQASWESKVRERPKVNRLAAYQSNNKLPVSNLRHEHVTLDAVENELVRILDGNRDHQALLTHLKKKATAGGFCLSKDDQYLKDPELIESTLNRVLEQTLIKLAKAALIEAYVKTNEDLT